MSLSTLRWIGAFAAVVALSASDARAQDQAGGPRSLIPSPAAADTGTVRSPVRLRDQARAGELLVPLNKSQVIEVDRSFAEVSVGNPEIADVVPLTRQSLYAPGKITNLMEVTGNQQVMLAVRFAEVSREVIKQLGAQTDFLFANGDVAIATDFGDLPPVDPLTFGSAAFALQTGDIALDVVLDALEQRGVVTTLAEPNLIALSGDTASFLAGGEFPIPVEQDDDGITIEFKPFGVSLSFTPTVIGDDLVNLELFTEVSDIDPTTAVLINQLSIPGLTTRRARTTVELRNGQGFAIAGLLRDDFEDTVRQYPILGNIPVLGQLFRSNGYQLDQSELVVVVTPYLVQPAAPTALLTPTDLFQAPSDAELFLQGKEFGERAGYDPSNSADRLGRRAAAGIVGPHGYILR